MPVVVNKWVDSDGQKRVMRVFDPDPAFNDTVVIEPGGVAEVSDGLAASLEADFPGMFPKATAKEAREAVVGEVVNDVA